MTGALPTIIVTGASGFIGRRFLEDAREQYRIFAIARRSQRETGVPSHPNITWIQVDIANWGTLKDVMRRIAGRRPVEFVLHLAAYYDFSNEENPEYERTNVNGTRHMLEQARSLHVRRFVFVSSIAACRAPAPGHAITERTPADADFPYARSKRLGEELVRDYSRWVPGVVLRSAAVYSDWCEYPPLYVFLSTWLSGRWNSRILGGRGDSAVPYIHIADLNRLVLTALQMSPALPAFDLFNASPDGSTTHAELFETATRLWTGLPERPIRIPAPLAAAGVALRDLVGQIRGRRPFERLWMMKYVDHRLDVDASYTRRVLGFDPTPRYHVLRRLLFLVEKMKSDPAEWRLRNEAALVRHPRRPGLRISESLAAHRKELAADVARRLQSASGRGSMPHYALMERVDLEWYAGIVLRLLEASARTGERSLLLEYMDELAGRRFAEGFGATEVRDALLELGETTISRLRGDPGLAGMYNEISDAIGLAIGMAADGVEDAYDRFRSAGPPSGETRGAGGPGVPAAAAARAAALESLIERLEAF